MATKMKVPVHELTKKLALWHTPTFRPLITHEDLEPIMESIGFIALPAPPRPTSASRRSPSSHSSQIQWKEYAFSSSSPMAANSGEFPHLPRPRLPFPRIDGLHLLAYKAFIGVLELYIAPSDVSNLFHVRSMTLIGEQDRSFKDYRLMRDSEITEIGMLLFREGTIDQNLLEQVAIIEQFAETKEQMNDLRLKNRSNNDPTVMVSLDTLLPNRQMTRL